MAAAYRHADIAPNHTYSINTIGGSYCKLTLNLKKQHKHRTGRNRLIERYSVTL